MNELKRILLVDDSERDIELSLAALAEHNLANQVVVAHDGEEALDYLYSRGVFAGRPEGLPVVVFLDVKMPRLNGIDVLKQIKSDPALRAMPVVMVTSSREETDLVESYRLGVNAYIVKPIDFVQFVECIKQVGIFWAVVNEIPKSRNM